MKEHEDWIRFESFREARKVIRSNNIEELIQGAARITSYVLNIPDFELVVMDGGKQKKKGKGGKRC